VRASAVETDKGAEFRGGPLRGGGAAVDACCVSGELLEGEELCAGLVWAIEGTCARTLVFVSGSTSHIIATEAGALGGTDNAQNLFGDIL
jgi:hypothetical protein